MTTFKALVLREEERGETSKSICVLTEELGLIYIYIRGGMKSKKSGSATQAFSYSTLCVDEKKNAKGQVSYYLNSSEPVKLFYNIRLDAKKLALAYYFSELLQFAATENSTNREENRALMRLTLNTLYFLDKGEHDMELLRSVFELRLICETGFMPKLIGCSSCFKYEDDIMHFNFLTNDLQCRSCCLNPDSIHDFKMNRSLLYTVRYIALSELEKLFSFRISERCQRQLTEFCEKLIVYDLKTRFVSLEYYKRM